MMFLTPTARRCAGFLAVVACAVMLAGCCSDHNAPLWGVSGGSTPPPQALNDLYQSIGNTPLKVSAANGVLADDQLNGGTISAFDATSTNGGTVAVNPDGSFTYTPKAGFVGHDTFTYTLSNGSGSSTAQVTIDISNLGFFVNNTAAAGGDGTFASPFNTLSQAITAAGPGDTIYVFQGDGTSTGLAGQVALQNGESIIGQGSSSFPTNGILLRANGVQAAGTSATSPVLTGPVVLASNNVVAGINLQSGTGAAITGGSVSNPTIEDNQISSAAGAIALSDVGGKVTFEGNTITGVDSANAAISDIQFSVGTNFLIENNKFQDDATVDPGDVISIFSEGQVVNATVSGNTVTGSNDGMAYDDLLNYYADMATSAGATINVTNNTSFCDHSSLDVSSFGGATLNITGNTFSGNTENTLAMTNGGANDTFSVTYGGPNSGDGNTHTGTDGGIYASNTGGTGVYLIKGNTISTTTDNQIVVSSAGGGQATAHVLGNNQGTAAGSVIQVTSADNTSTMDTAIRNNTVASIQVTNNGGTEGAAISDNTGTEIDLFDTGSLLSVEGLDAAHGGPLDTLNPYVTNIVTTGSPVAVDVGSLGL